MIVRKILVVVGLLSLVGGWLWKSNCSRDIGCMLAGGTVNGFYCFGADNRQVYAGLLACNGFGLMAITMGVILLIVAYFMSGKPKEIYKQ